MNRLSPRFAQVVTATVAVLMTMLMSFPRAALAVDGVIEINQARVIAAGGFPFKIISFGSYRLTSNLSVNSAADGIDVNASYVDIDLNGFAIVVNTANLGINGTGTNVTVHDGKVLNTSTACAIQLRDSSVVRNVITFGSCGIEVGNNSAVAGSVAQNCLFGIIAGDNSRISGNTVNGNRSEGISVTSGGLVVDNVIAGNSGSGLDCGGSTTTGYARNIFTSNSPNVTGCTNLGENLCDGKICP